MVAVTSAPVSASTPNAAPAASTMPAPVLIRAEGVLWRQHPLGPAAYLAANAQGFAERALRLTGVLAVTPLVLGLRQNDRGTGVRAAAFACRHMSQDRVEMLLEEYRTTRWAPRLTTGGQELLQRAAREERPVVVLSELLQPVLESLAAEWPASVTLLANRLEFKGGVCTGRLLEPVVGDGPLAWQRLASERGWDLRGARAYAAAGPDAALLAAVGDPCAVNPDFTLRQAARAAAWPVLDFDA